MKKAKVTLKWNDVACETRTKVRVKDLATTKVAFKSNPAADATQVKTSALPRDKFYRWFVKECNSFGCAKSEVWRFFVKP
jgi:hypothetical protein